ncbi:MAG: hypothetical protein JOY52_11645 [Hyphomicrobiales bacterium]|nr:hypothetical protein [Acidobacteriaceae bacterium]MBV9908204.1 hypothetical protein [Hyphomicrobiales bacterium]
MRAFERIVIPALQRFQPELVLVTSGLDASSHDWLGRMNLHSDSYRALVRLLLDVAAEVCEGRIAFCHEGGYSPTLTPFLGLAILETLSGIHTAIQDPFLSAVARQPSQALAPHQQVAIESAAIALDTIPTLRGRPSSARSTRSSRLT